MGGWRHRIVSIVGTRPEAIKMAPLAAALECCGAVDHRLLLTGQHGGLERCFDLPPGRVRSLGFDPRGLTRRVLLAGLHALLRDEFQARPIDLVLVHGDTTSAVAGAFAARDRGLPLGHVEAGLRSFDLRQPRPEEGHRIVIDSLADLLFAPSGQAADNLHREGMSRGRIWVTGNTGIDALLKARARLPRRRRTQDGRRLVLVTCHRRENGGRRMGDVCHALKRIVRELPVRIVLPLHPNRHRRRIVEEALGGTALIDLVEPLEYEAMVRLMDESWLILSDSGGVQEEAPALGRPLLVLRDVTERPEAVATGNIELVGTDPERIVGAVAALLDDPSRYDRMARPAFPFGDGRAAGRIVRAVEDWLADADIVMRPEATAQ